jgi:hypothetical protein
LVAGGPNKDQTLIASSTVPGKSYAYSFIDVHNLYVLATAPPAPGTAPPFPAPYTSTIYSSASAQLGVVMALAEDASVLVSAFDTTRLVAYSPVVAGRGGTGGRSQFGDGAADAFLTLPDRFAPQSMQIRGGVRPTVLCCVVLCCVVLCCVGQMADVLMCCAVLCCAVLCCAVLCCAVLCCAVLCCAVLCSLWW